MLKKIGFCLACICCYWNANAQVGLANANSGATMGSSQSGGTSSGSNVYSVDLYSGTVNVNIPIYNYSIDGLDLGVSLSYNTAGIKVDQVASDAGLGWSLNTGGIITREVHGLQDELREREIDTLVPGTTSTYITASREQRGSWVDDRDRDGTGSCTPRFDNEDEPDIFTAVIGNRSIKFSLADYSSGGYCYNAGTMHLYTFPKQNVWVDVYYSDSNSYCGYYKTPRPCDSEHTNYILRFKITDEKGNQFFFDRGEYQVRDYRYKTFHSTTNVGEAYYEVPVTWVLKKVITYTGAVIVYDYEDDTYSYPAYKNQLVRETDQFFDPTSTSTVPVFDGNIEAINEEVTTLYHAKRLKSITYPNGDVLNFNTDGNARLDRVSGTTSTDNQAVSSISISNGYSTSTLNTLKYKFNYAYYSAYTGTGTTPDPTEVSYPTNSVPDHTHNLRLKLLSIDKIGTDNSTTEKYYSFDYINDDTHRLPARLSGYTDCYGYYNNRALIAPVISPMSSTYSDVYTNLFYMIMPWHSFTFVDNTSTSITCTYGRNMSPDWTYAQSGLLKTIVNGLGGSVEFTYQDHNLGNPIDFSAPSTTPLYSSSSYNTGYFDRGDVYLNNAPGTEYYYPPNDLDFCYANDGVCIQQIECKDGYNTDNTVTTTYDFSDGASTPGPGGLRLYPAGYFWEATEFAAGIGTYGGSVASYPIQRLYHNSFVTPMDLINGSNHAYTHARVKTTGYGSAVVSDKAYTFTNLIAGSGETVNGTTAPSYSRLSVHYGPGSHAYPRQTFDKAFMGLLKEEIEYDNTGSYIISKTTNTFDEHLYPDSVKATYQQSAFCFGVGTDLYEFDYYNFKNSRVHLTSTTTEQHSSSGSTATSIALTKNFTYDSDGDLLTATYTDSKGNEIKEENGYLTSSYDEDHGGVGWIGTLTHGLKYLTTKATYITAPSSSSYVTGYSDITTDGFGTGTNCYTGLGNSVTYYDGGLTVIGPMGHIRFNKVHSFFNTDKVLSTSWSSAYQKMTKHFTVYDDHNNVLETGYNEDRNYSSAVWDTRIGKKAVEVKNAQYVDIAATSFEGQFLASSTLDYNKGNWKFEPDNVVLGSSSDPAVTGKYYYNLITSTYIRFANTPIAKKYNISVWYKGVMPSASCASAITLTNQITINGWTLATGSFTGDGSSFVNVWNPSSTASCKIDELRLSPSDASMESYTYEPLIGISSHCDERNVVTYFEYDVMGRPTVTRDADGNIISLTKHVVQGSDY